MSRTSESGGTNRIVIWGVALAVAVAIAAIATHYLRRPPTPAAEVTQQEAPPREPAPKPEPLPTRADSDRLLRDLLARLSAASLWATWWGQDDLLTRVVALIDSVAEGASPRAHLEFLTPRERFSVVERGGREYMDPKSFARYDAVGDVAASLDMQAVAGAYLKIRPLLDAAYRHFGYPNRSIDPVVSRALRRIASVPVPAERVEVVSRGAMWVYADARYEDLGAAEKHLLRMGRRNLEIVQHKTRELQKALALDP